MAALVLAMASCTELLPQRTASVHVHIPGFTINQGEIRNTKAAQNAADYADVKAITLAFFSGSEKIIRSHTIAERSFHLHLVRRFYL